MAVPKLAVLKPDRARSCRPIIVAGERRVRRSRGVKATAGILAEVNGAAKVLQRALAAAEEDEAVGRRAMPPRQPGAAMKLMPLPVASAFPSGRVSRRSFAAGREQARPA